MSCRVGGRGPAASRAARVVAAVVVLLVAGAPTASASSQPALTADRTAAMFTASQLTPGATSVACTTVSWNRDRSALLTMRARLGEAGLADFLTLRVEQVGTGGCAAAPRQALLYTGSLRGLATAAAADRPAIQVTGAVSIRYRIQLTVMDDDRAQGQQATADFLWQAESTPDPVPPPPPAPEPTPTPTPETPEPPPVTVPDPTTGLPVVVPEPTVTPTVDPDGTVIVPPIVPNVPDVPEPVATVPAPQATDDVTPMARPSRPGDDGRRPDAELIVPGVGDRPPPTEEAQDEGVVAGIGRTVTRTVDAIKRVGQVAAPVVARTAAPPLALAAGVGAFLVLQRRLDRQDPKLSVDAVYARPRLPFVVGGLRAGLDDLSDDFRFDGPVRDATGHDATGHDGPGSGGGRP